MHLTFRQLKVFEAVARLGSYTRAAGELHLTQPAVSMQIKQLEENIGLALFDATGRKLTLTEAGTEVLDLARAVARRLADAEALIDSLKGLRQGHLRLAVATTANYFAPRLLLAPFSQRHPGVRVSLDVTNREGLLRALDENTCDLVIMGQPPAGLDLVAEPFLENPLVVIAPSGHPLASRQAVPLDRLREETFVVREQGSGTRIAMERFFAARGVTLTTGMEMSSNEAIKQAVEAGLGLGILSLHTLALEREAGRLVVLDVEGFPIVRHWYLVHRAGKRLSPMAEAFREFVRKRT